MVVGLLVWYLFGKTSLMIYTIFCFLASVIVFNSSMKFYFPKMKNTDLQHFHDKYPEFIRTDLPHINLGRIFFFTFSILFLKILVAYILTVIIYIRLKRNFDTRNPEIDFKNEDIPVVKNILSLARYICYSMGVLDIREKNDYPIEIYRKFLGPDYVPPEKFTTIVLNHTCWMDILYYLYKHCPGFISKESVKNYFLIGFIAKSIRSVFLDRTKKDNRSIACTKIVDTQNKIMNGELQGSICIFPEGTTSNGKYLLEFKKGAFSGLTPVKPYFSKCMNTPFEFSIGVLNISLHCYLTLCYLYHSVEIHELPVIEPTEYLYDNYKHLGSNKAEIYQEAVKHIISEVSGFTLSKSSFEAKLNYLSEIQGKMIKNT